MFDVLCDCKFFCIYCLLLFGGVVWICYCLVIDQCIDFCNCCCVGNLVGMCDIFFEVSDICGVGDGDDMFVFGQYLVQCELCLGYIGVLCDVVESIDKCEVFCLVIVDEVWLVFVQVVIGQGGWIVQCFVQ